MQHIKHIQSLAFVFLLSFISQASSVKIDNWTFRKVNGTQWYPATVPGGIYKDLKKNGRIPDPYVGTNEKQVSWVDSAEWEYKSVFDVPASILKSKNARIEFSSLDTYAEVMLNDSLILKANNMFKSYSVNVRSLLKGKNNQLTIRFKSDLLAAIALQKAGGMTLPGDERVQIRKAAYKFGWDFGPRFIAGGIAGEVMLKASEELEIQSVHAFSTLQQDSSADVQVRMDVYSAISDSVRITLKCKETGDSVLTVVGLKEGKNSISPSLRLNRPMLWWPNGCGKQNLYSVSATIRSSKGVMTEASSTTGVRSISLVREKDEIGSTFYFKVNGNPVYMRGANIVPPDHFTDGGNDSLWVNLVRLAKSMNMNMLRVWGGGVYPPEAFFQACDRNGILVWQDFMFACGMYPGSNEFIENVREEATQQVNRISVHPSLALWCGNNENDEGWKNWGWQKQYKISAADSAKMWKDYQRLFDQLLADVVRDYSPSLVYVPTSPKNGWGRKESLTEGDCHYWGVWWGKEPFSTYAGKVPRFMSEFGFQSLPDVRSLSTFTGEKTIDLKSAAMKSHQKHPTGYETIEEYRKALYSSYSDIEQYVYQSQMTQWNGLSTAIQAERNSNRRCMGTLIWQLNDTWPGVSWSLIDYYGKKKASAYKLAEEFQPVSIYLSLEGNDLVSEIVSDSSADFEVVLSMRQCSMDGEIIKTFAETVKVPKNGTKKVKRTFTEVGSCFYAVDLIKVSSTSYLVNSSVSSSPKPEVKIALITILGKKALQITCNEIVKNVQFSLDGNTDILEQNYLDLYPRNPRYITLKDQSITEVQVKNIRILTN